MGTTHKSFIREILKVTEDPKIISFAGGLPNPKFFPVKEIANASLKVLEENGENVLQYSTTEGYLPLREYIAERYRKKKRRDLMVSMIAEYFPEEIKIKYTKPEGGMFLWITLPERISSLDLVDLAIKENVAFVPGKAFYVDGGGNNTLRLNFSNSDEEEIEEGIKRLAKIMKKALS
jgi:DNA-binding transcriptional MocR family regulator